MKNILKLTRPYQWIKNFFVFMPLFFGGSLLNHESVLQALYAFFAFSFIASSIYCFNDILDVEADRRHEEKCKRPIASGAVSMLQGYCIMAVCVALSVGCCFLLEEKALATLAVIAFYFVLEILYCVWLKRIAVIDVCILAAGFVLRIIAGGVATDIVPSHWLVMMTFLITLLMAFGKRKDDVIKYNKTGVAPRHNTKSYNLTFIDQAITVNAGVTLVCYILYTVSPEVASRTNFQYAYLTSIFVIIGLLRYMQQASVEGKSGNPTKLVLKDRFLQVTVLLWMVSFLAMIYII